MKSKIFEVRDKGTLVPVMATMVSNNTGEDSYEDSLMTRAGYGTFGMVIMTILATGESTNDPYKWDNSSRTFREAHQYIYLNYYKLNSGDVIDVEYILGETTTKKESEVN